MITRPKIISTKVESTNHDASRADGTRPNQHEIPTPDRDTQLRRHALSESKSQRRNWKKQTRHMQEHVHGRSEEVRVKQSERARQCSASERPWRNWSSCREHMQRERMQSTRMKSTRKTHARLMENPWEAQAHTWRTWRACGNHIFHNTTTHFRQ